MINGAFGVGKTSVAAELLETMDNTMLFDQEEVGFMLRHLIPDNIKKVNERTDNFQDLEMWRSLTVQVAEQLKKTYSKNLSSKTFKARRTGRKLVFSTNREMSGCV